LELFLPLDLHEELRGVYAAMLENSPAAWHHENGHPHTLRRAAANPLE